MGKLKISSLMIALSVTWLGGCSSEQEAIELNVSAASSLQEVTTELAEQFMENHPHVNVHLNFAGSNQLQQQIVEGFPVDIFMSAHVDPHQALVDIGLVNEGGMFATSPVVLVSSSPEINSVYDLANHNVDLIFAGETVPIGIYTHLILSEIDLQQSGFREAVLNNVISRAANVREALLYVTLNESDATFVYMTDLTEDLLSELTLIELPEAFQVEGTYYIAVIEQDGISEAATEFYRFVLSTEGQEVLEEYGFNGFR